MERAEVQRLLRSSAQIRRVELQRRRGGRGRRRERLWWPVRQERVPEPPSALPRRGPWRRAWELWCGQSPTSRAPFRDLRSDEKSRELRTAVAIIREFFKQEEESSGEARIYARVTGRECGGWGGEREREFGQSQVRRASARLYSARGWQLYWVWGPAGLGKMKNNSTIKEGFEFGGLANRKFQRPLPRAEGQTTQTSPIESHRKGRMHAPSACSGGHQQSVRASSSPVCAPSAEPRSEARWTGGSARGPAWR